MTGKIAASGNAMSMLNYAKQCQAFCLAYMFSNCKSLISAPELPATQVYNYCYSNMFANCSSLTQAPELPATKLALSCYYNMFNGCTSLAEAPELSATTLEQSCYSGMFRNCTSLTAAPTILPATRLAYYCYSNMFQGCTSLTQAPELRCQQNLDGIRCLEAMFSGCKKLSYLNVAFTTWGGTYTFLNWVNDVSSTGTFEAPTELPVQFGVSRIPEGWTVPNGKYIIASNQTFTGKANEEVNYQIVYSIYPVDLKPTFTIVEGSLPAGLSLDSSTGIISGTTTEAFTGSITIRISAEGCQDVDIVISIIIEGKTDIDPTGLFLYHPLNEQLTVLPTGQSCTNTGTVEYTTFMRSTDGIF